MKIRSLRFCFIGRFSEAAIIGLRINATKTKYLLAGDSYPLGSSVLVDGDNLVAVKEFCYLETVVTSNNDIGSEIQRRIAQGNGAYYGLHRLLMRPTMTL